MWAQFSVHSQENMEHVYCCSVPHDVQDTLHPETDWILEEKVEFMVKK